MEIVIDSAKREEIEDAYCCDVLDDVTTNPALIKAAVDELQKSGEEPDIAEYIRKIPIAARSTPVSYDVTELCFERMVEQERHLFEMFNPIAENVYITIQSIPRLMKRETLPDKNGPYRIFL